MSLSNKTTIINVTTGDPQLTSLKYFIKFQHLLTFIANKWQIPTNQILIILPYGSKLTSKNFSSYHVDQGPLYVFDRRLFQLNNKPSATSTTTDHLHDEAETLLDTLLSHHRKRKDTELIMLVKPIHSPLEEWQTSTRDETETELTYNKVTSLITTNLGWLSALEIDVHYFANIIKDTMNEVVHLLDSLCVCEQYLKLYFFDVMKLYDSNVQFLQQLQGKGLDVVSHWQQCYESILSKLNCEETSLQAFVDEESLREKQNAITDLDKKVNDKLNNVKINMDNNSKCKDDVGVHIQSIRREFTLDESKYVLEDTMLSKFNGLVETMKSRSREVLNKETDEFNVEYLKSVKDMLIDDKLNATKILLTIAQALYSQAEQLFQLKRSLQVKSIIIFGQIAFIQLETLKLKKILLSDCNKDLEKYQKYEIEFAQVEDLPLVYGLFLIESYRIQSWYYQMLLDLMDFAKSLETNLNSETYKRERWKQKFRSLTNLFKDTSDNGMTSLLASNLSEFFKDGISNVTTILREQYLPNYKQKCLKFYHNVEVYLTQLQTVDVPEKFFMILSQNFNTIKHLPTLTTLSSSPSSSLSSPDMTNQQISELDGYKVRIKKLESLLHESKYLRYEDWPSGILLNKSPSMSSKNNIFRNNLSSINTKLAMSTNNSMNLTLQPDNEQQEEIEQYVSYQPIDNNMQIQINELQDIITDLKMNLESTTKELTMRTNEVVDLKIECKAYRETLTNLNSELSRLTETDEKEKINRVDRDAIFKKQMIQMIEKNKTLMSEVETWKGKCTELQETNDKSVEIEELKKMHSLELGSIRETHDQQIKKLQDKISSLETQKVSTVQLSEDVKETMDVAVSTEEDMGSKEESVIDVATVTECDKEREEKREGVKAKELTPDIIERNLQNAESELFEIFSSNITILENIGLLLTYADDRSVQIKRVKGLRKGAMQSMLDETTQFTEADRFIKSSVFHEIQSSFTRIQEGNDKMENRVFFLNNIETIYSEKLYETAVIRRFKDIEFLAKKLTKENKLKRSLLEQYQREKLTLKNFEIGDTVLFLPTREDFPADGSYSGSMNSSFSSVDLSTPPPFETTKTQPSLIGSNSNIDNDVTEKPTIKRPWAAFTAFDENTRYLLRDVQEQTKGRDWAIGQIKTMQKFAVDGTNFNPFKLQKGTIWYQVTADIITSRPPAK
ncbi:hypothetical protein NCAS_0A10990 [Naumovozyma castellii]|uniref:Autophagy-related protein 11 n=1 Tax=Naumovozyma castellii TaxID=27288 RepID=G0V859_NAUCA|nr:hypothetical protein NCAS_0A10990 [Naumovozyma castellii CBS 4309]CCC67657.1 hypothetical protein NCAS_0A10990 [Naumovozyma castellii CBS 4309]